MSTEETESMPHYGDDGHSAGSTAAPAQAGEGSGKEPGSGNSSRRRRRRRKNKGAAGREATPLPASAAGDEGSAAPVAAPPTPAAAVTPQREPGSNQQNGGGGKRKHGRKRGGSGGPAQGNGGAPSGGPQPGNQQRRTYQNRQNGGSGQGGGGWKSRNADGPDGNREGARGGFGSGEHFGDANGNSSGRKGKFGRRGPTSFVGPMDHSYRMVNGNVADGPPSTLDYRNTNGNMSGRNDQAEFGPVASLREDAPTRIVCFIEDLFVVAKMQETARKLGVKVQFAKAEKETLAAITDAPETERPSLIVFDLNNGKPLTAIPKLKAKLKRGTSIIGFVQQIQGDLKMKAIEAGCDTVMPKAAFSQNLPNLLRRHGLAEEEEMVGA